MHYQGKLYRALNPVYAREPLSGRGTALFGGRFNLIGRPTLYVATTLPVAIREANQVGDLQPTTIVAYDADVDTIFDTRDTASLAPFGMTPAALADPGWRDQMKTAGQAPTQIFAERLIADGYNGMLVRSFARGATDTDLNLVLWAWAGAITLIDDEDRLGRI
jgi:RES domain-containing protein